MLKRMNTLDRFSTISRKETSVTYSLLSITPNPFEKGLSLKGKKLHPPPPTTEQFFSLFNSSKLAKEVKELMTEISPLQVYPFHLNCSLFRLIIHLYATTSL